MSAKRRHGNAVNKLFTRYGSKPGPQPDLAAIQLLRLYKGSLIGLGLFIGALLRFYESSLIILCSFLEVL